MSKRVPKFLPLPLGIDERWEKAWEAMQTHLPGPHAEYVFGFCVWQAELAHSQEPQQSEFTARDMKALANAAHHLEKAARTTRAAFRRLIGIVWRTTQLRIAPDAQCWQDEQEAWRGRIAADRGLPPSEASSIRTRHEEREDFLEARSKTPPRDVVDPEANTTIWAAWHRDAARHDAVNMAAEFFAALKSAAKAEARGRKGKAQREGSRPKLAARVVAAVDFHLERFFPDAPLASRLEVVAAFINGAAGQKGGEAWSAERVRRAYYKRTETANASKAQEAKRQRK